MFDRIKYFVLLAVFITMSRFISSSAAEIKFPLLWQVELKSFLESAPTVADIDGDGRDEIVIAGMEEMIALGKNGRELWRWRTKRRFMTYPAVLERKKKLSLIYAADNSGLLTCLNGAGQVVWQAQLDEAASWSAPVVADVDANGTPELIQADESGTVWAFDALTGAVVWRSSVHGKPASPAVGDLDGDGQAEIVVTTNEGMIAALQGDGAVLWEREIGAFCETWATSSPVLFAASGGKAYIAAATSSGQFFCLDQDGKTVWQHRTRGPVASTISAGDFDGDGRADLFLITQLGVVYRFDETGTVLWEIDMQGRSLAPGAIIDVDNDGKLEYVLCTQRGHLMALDNDGAIIFDHQFDNRTINVTPTFGDVARSSRNLEMVITGGESGRTFCFATSASPQAAAPWPSYRADVRNSGAWFGLAQSGALRMIPQSLVWDQLFIGEDIRFAIYNPDPGEQPLKASAVCIRPDGSRQVAITTVMGERGELLMPVEFTVPGLYHFTWTLTDARGRELVSAARTVTYQPFANDRALVERAIASLLSTAREAEATLPLTANALRRLATQLKLTAKEIRPLQEAVPGSDAESIRETLAGTADLTEKARRALAMSEVIEKAMPLGPGTSLIAFEGVKWENRNVDRQLPASVENPLKLSYTVVPGEHQPIPLLLFNITDKILNVRLQIESLPDGIRLTPLRSVATPTSVGEMSWDALPQLDESGVIGIPSLSSREIWLDVDVGAGQPGTHEIDLHLYALNGASVLDAPTNPHPVPAPVTDVAVSLNVLPFEMAPSGDFRLCTWSPSTGPAIPDLLAHGNNVFLARHGTVKYNPSGHIDSIDFSSLDTVIESVKGYDVILLLNGFPALNRKPGEPDYRKALAEYLHILVRHLADRGINTDHFALYPIDEPGGHGWNYVNQLVEFGRMVHEVDPEIKMYMDGGGDVPMIEAMATCVDIWVPPIEWIGQDLPEMRGMRASNKLMWSYNCSYGFSRPIGPNLKNTNIIAEYRLAALFAMRHGASGIGYWCYNAGREDAWQRIKLEYNLVYPGRTGPVTSRRWEAVREGIEDYRILAALKKYLDSDRQGSVNETVRKKIEHLFRVSLPQLVDPGFRVMKLGMSRDVIDANSNDALVDAFRREMMECVELLTK